MHELLTNTYRLKSRMSRTEARADERVQLLCQIRGVAGYTAMLIIAEVGASVGSTPPGTFARGPD